MRKGRRKAKRSSEKEVLLSEGFALELDNSLRESNYTANLGESQNHDRNEDLSETAGLQNNGEPVDVLWLSEMKL